MPARILDGDALWTSKTLRLVEPETLRGEYANLLPLALANGVFELDADEIWTKVYAFLRPHFSREDVLNMIREFERVGLIFRFTKDGKTWGYFVGIEKPGRLPSDAHKKRYKVGPHVPQKELHEYVERCHSLRVGIRSLSGLYPDNIPQGSGSGSGSGSGLDQERSQKTLALAPRRKTSTTPASPEIFTGARLKVTGSIDKDLDTNFPGIERVEQYRAADRWLVKTGAKRPGVRKFLFNWFEREIEKLQNSGKGSKANERTKNNLRAIGAIQ